MFQPALRSLPFLALSAAFNVRMHYARVSAPMPLRASVSMQLLEPLPSPKELYEAVSGFPSVEGLSVVLFSSRQCGLCRGLLPRVRKLAATHGDVRFFSLEHSSKTDEAFLFHEVTTVPSFILFDGSGSIVDSMTGLTLSDFGKFKAMVVSIITAKKVASLQRTTCPFQPQSPPLPYQERR